MLVSHLVRLWIQLNGLIQNVHGIIVVVLGQEDLGMVTELRQQLSVQTES